MVELGIYLIYACLLIVIFVIDLKHQLVLDKVIYPGMVLALALSFFWPGLGVVNSLAGGAFGLAAMALPFIIYRQGIGFGDVKLGALVGLMTGFPLVIIAIMLSWIIGGLVAAVLLVFKIKRLKDPIPAATFITTSTMVTLLWGEAIWQWVF